MAKTFRKNALTAAVALAIGLTPAAPALAWGDREQGALTGIAGTLLLQSILRDLEKNRAPRPQPYPQPYPYPYPQPQPPHGHRPPPVYEEHGSIYRTSLARAWQSYSSRDRRAIQRELAGWGYYRGQIDGAFGPGTYSAVVAYARRTGQSEAVRSMAGAYGVYDSLLY